MDQGNADATGGRTAAGSSPKGILLAFLCATVAACGNSVVTPTAAASPVATATGENFQVDANAAHYHPIHHAIFGPWYGSGCPDFGACGCGGATNLAQESTCQLQHLADNDIPVSAYLFDGSAWSQTSSFGPCTGPDCCSWKLGDALVEQMRNQDVRALLHFWGGCHAPDQYQRAHDSLGRTLLGFYLDDGASDAELQQVAESMQSLIAGDWENVAKTYQNGEPSISDSGLTKWANAGYVGDLTYDFQGLKDGVNRVLSKASLIPAPFAEFTGYAYLDPGSPDEEAYRRRLHFGAMQPVMAQTPYGNSDPWSPRYSPDLLASYRYWAWLHRELVPYFYSCAYRMFENGAQPVLQAGPNPYSLLVGDLLYVPIVTESTSRMDIQLPQGQWVDYWDESQVLAGSLAGFPVPVGQEPIFVRQGSLIPLDVERTYAGHGTNESAGSLTVLVYPSDVSSFRYRQDAGHPWITFGSSMSGDQLTLTADPNPPAQPVLYRIARWPEEPASVAVDGPRVTVNQGGTLPRVATEAAVNGSTQSAWFYDASAHRLIVKAVS